LLIQVLYLPGFILIRQTLPFSGVGRSKTGNAVEGLEYIAIEGTQ